MVGNEEQKNVNDLPKNITPNLDEGLNKQVSRFQTVEGSRTHETVQGIRSASCNQIFSEAEWKEFMKGVSGVFTDDKFPASQQSLVGDVNPTNPELAE